LYQHVEAFPLVNAERYDVSLYGRLFRDHDVSPGYRRYRFRDWPQNQRRGALGIGLAAGFIPSGALGGEPSFRGQTNGIWLWQNGVGAMIFAALLDGKIDHVAASAAAQ
jgi:hypothetical protein